MLPFTLTSGFQGDSGFGWGANAHPSVLSSDLQPLRGPVCRGGGRRQEELRSVMAPVAAASSNRDAVRVGCGGAQPHAATSLVSSAVSLSFSGGFSWAARATFLCSSPFISKNVFHSLSTHWPVGGSMSPTLALPCPVSPPPSGSQAIAGGGQRPCGVPGPGTAPPSLQGWRGQSSGDCVWEVG